LIDIGVNLLHPQFESDREAVVSRARDAGVVDMLITATDLELAHRAIEFSERHDLYCTAGIHPHDAKDAPGDLAERLDMLAGSARVKAIGETGLDFNRNFSPPDDQRNVFEAQLELACSTGLPVFVHDRESDGAVFRALARHAGELSGMVVHCFTGTKTDLNRYLELGCHIGVTGWICDERRGGELRALVRDIPLDRLLVETDAPFLLPHSTPDDWHAKHAPGAHKRRNEPALLQLVVDRIAEEMGVEPDEVRIRTAENARLLFDLPDRADHIP
jgi:TatD DNase family protein